MFADFGTTPVTYQANITTPSGVYSTDSGTANTVGAFSPFPTSLAPEAFREQFLTSNGVAAVRSQTKDDCKDGGYVHCGYKNQGQCVSDVNHGSRSCNSSTGPAVAMTAGTTGWWLCLPLLHNAAG